VGQAEPEFMEVKKGVTLGWNKLALRKSPKICVLNPSFLAFIVSEISAFIRADRRSRQNKKKV